MGAGGSFKPITIMKITPIADILISGNHSPAGIPCETSPAIASALVAQGLARFTRTDSEVETAEARPVIETATARPARKRA